MDLFIPFKILVVDFQDHYRQEYLKELSSTGFSAAGEKHGHNAEAAGEGIQPDLFIVALEMPRLDGVFLIRKLRKHDNFQDTPIVALTPKIDRQRVKDLQGLDVKDVLRTPLPPGHLLKMAEKYYKLKVIAEITKEG